MPENEKDIIKEHTSRNGQFIGFFSVVLALAIVIGYETVSHFSLKKIKCFPKFKCNFYSILKNAQLLEGNGL